MEKRRDRRMRKICQRDIFYYMNEELRVPQKEMCLIFNKVRQGNMVETRVSEIKQGKRKGYRGLKDAALPCFLQCFQGKEEELQFQKLLRFVKEEQLYFPGVEEEEDFQTYALRFLEYGLENCEIPIETGGGLPEATPVMKLALFPPALENRTVPDTPASLQEKLRNHPRYLLLVSLCFLALFLYFVLFSQDGLSLFMKAYRLSFWQFILLLLFLAVSPLLFGLIDVVIAVYAYRKKHPGEDISLREISFIAKYGEKDSVIQGRGRYDLNPRLIFYSIACNLTGSFSAIALYLFLHTLADFAAFAEDPHFVAMANIVVYFNMLTTFAQTFFLFTREPMRVFRENVENPDTKRADRLHVIVNSIYMVYSMSFTAIGVALALLYSYDHAIMGKMPLSPYFALAIFTSHLFLWFSSCSPFAVQFNAECAGSFIFLSPIVVILSSLCSVLCFDSGMGVLLLNLVNFVAILTWLCCFLRSGVEKGIFHFIRAHRAYFALYVILFFLFYILSVHL